MSPGSLSQLTLSDAIAFRVDFHGELPPRRALYWRGPVMWDFDGRTWRLGNPALAELEPPTTGTRIEYSVLLEPHNRNWLFALDRPASLPAQSRYLDDGQIISVAPVRARLPHIFAPTVGKGQMDLIATDADAPSTRHRLPRLGNDGALDILPAMNDQDSNRSPGGNVLRFALHRQGQNSQVSTRCHGKPCRGSLLVLLNGAGFGYRPTRRKLSPSTDRQKGLLPALKDQVSTLGKKR
jgi:hypothetical protein